LQYIINKNTEEKDREELTVECFLYRKFFRGFTVFYCDIALDVHLYTEATPFFLITFFSAKGTPGPRVHCQDLNPGPTKWQAGTLTIELHLTPFELCLTPEATPQP